jgi:hypothetical protein
MIGLKVGLVACRSVVGLRKRARTPTQRQQRRLVATRWPARLGDGVYLRSDLCLVNICREAVPCTQIHTLL